MGVGAERCKLKEGRGVVHHSVARGVREIEGRRERDGAV